MGGKPFDELSAKLKRQPSAWACLRGLAQADAACPEIGRIDDGIADKAREHALKELEC